MDDTKHKDIDDDFYSTIEGDAEGLDQSYPYLKQSRFFKILHKLLDVGKLYASDSDTVDKVYEFDHTIKSFSIINRSENQIKIMIYGDELKGNVVEIHLDPHQPFNDVIKGGFYKMEILADGKYEILFRR